MRGEFEAMLMTAAKRLPNASIGHPCWVKWDRHLPTGEAMPRWLEPITSSRKFGRALAMVAIQIELLLSPSSET